MIFCIFLKNKIIMKTLFLSALCAFTASLQAQNHETIVELKDALAINQPLLIVDGLKMNKDGVPLSTAMSGINSNDITKLEVVKGESAIEQYGEQGRKGVILVSTKRGNTKKSNPKP